MLLHYLRQRLAFAGVALLGVGVVAFLVAHLVPADPLAAVLSDIATKDPSIRAQYMERWGLDRPLPEQFFYYLKNVARGDLGESFTTRRPVLHALAQYVLATIVLSVAASGGSVVLGVPLGVWSALLEVLAADYLRTARAKGLGERRVVGIHALRNALIPVLTVAGLAFASLLSGAVLTETVFAWPGIGRYAVTAATRLDYPAILGVTLLTGVIYISVNFIVDLLYGVLDPRIRV